MNPNTHIFQTFTQRASENTFLRAQILLLSSLIQMSQKDFIAYDIVGVARHFSAMADQQMVATAL